MVFYNFSLVLPIKWKIYPKYPILLFLIFPRKFFSSFFPFPYFSPSTRSLFTLLPKSLGIPRISSDSFLFQLPNVAALFFIKVDPHFQLFGPFWDINTFKLSLKSTFNMCRQFWIMMLLKLLSRIFLLHHPYYGASVGFLSKRTFNIRELALLHQEEKSLGLSLFYFLGESWNHEISVRPEKNANLTTRF